MPIDLRLLTSKDDVKGCIVLIPAGSLEQHCNLPIGTDCLIAEKLAWKACESFESVQKFMKCVVTPPLCYGFSPEWKPTAGTISLSLFTFSQLLREIIVSLAKWGFERIVVFNAHAGNSNIISSTLSELSSELKEKVLAQIDYWKCFEANLGHGSFLERYLLEELKISFTLREENCRTAKVSKVPGLKIFTRGKEVPEIIPSDFKSIDLKSLLNCLVEKLKLISKISFEEHYVS